MQSRLMCFRRTSLAILLVGASCRSVLWESSEDATARGDQSGGDVRAPTPDLNALDLANETFCTGDLGRVAVGASLMQPVPTTGSLLAARETPKLDIVVHTEPWLRDFVHLTLQSLAAVDHRPGFAPGEIVIGDDADQPAEVLLISGIEGTVYGSGRSQVAPRIRGTVNVLYDPFRERSNGTYLVRFCLGVHAPGDPLDGLRLYVPTARVMCPWGWGCFEPGHAAPGLYLLDITAAEAASRPIESLHTRSVQPFLDPFNLRFYRKADHHFALEPDCALPELGVEALPFVVVGGSRNLYLGALTKGGISVPPTLSTIRVENPRAGAFVIDPPVVGPDPRGDPRFLGELDDLAKSY